MSDDTTFARELVILDNVGGNGARAKGHFWPFYLSQLQFATLRLDFGASVIFSRSKSTLVKEVVEIVMKELGRPVVSDDDFKGLIGMRDHFNKLESLLINGSPKLQILGIWGMPGIGKTTIANAVFSRLFPRFESFYFLRNVREGSEKYGLERLRDELIAKLLQDENINFGILSNPIAEHAKDRLRRTKVLLVLDDVSEKKQLEHLVGDHFGSESRIIVTTRDEGVLRGTNIEADFEKYEVELLSFEESLWLFNITTFRESSSPPEYEDLSSEVVKYLGRNPLAITVFGSHLRSLRNPSKHSWEMELEKLRECSHDDIQKVLRISYTGLDKFEKKIFLDIACFFKGMSRGFVENVLNGCNFFASTGLDDLVDKSLISMDTQNNLLHMHDLVQQMGWQIVREESEEPGNRSRIFTAEDACHVLNNDKGTNKIEGIFLDTSKLDEDVHLKPEVFQTMDKLRLLKIYEESYFNWYSNSTKEHKVYVEELDYFPRSLRYLEWQKFPLKSLPSKFDLRNLVELTMPCSQLEELWDRTQNLNKLTCIDLSHSINLTQIPDLSHAQNLETLNLEKCSSLLQFPWDSLQNLNKLVNLNLGGCLKVGNFPDRIDARVLKSLNLSGCINLKTVPDIVSQSLVFLNLESTDIVSVPPAIGSIKSLSELSLMNCELLKNLPNSLTQLNRLEKLFLTGCSSLGTVPELPVNIKDLYLAGLKMLESLPSNIFKSSALKSLCLNGCSNLKDLPEIPNHVESNLKSLYLNETGINYLPLNFGNLTNLELLWMEKCANLEFIGDLSTLGNLYSLEMRDCKRLQHLSQLPLSLHELDAAGCTSLETVLDSTSNTFKTRFWDNNPHELKFDTFNCSIYTECLKLDQSALHSILAEFQLKVLNMATSTTTRKFQMVESPEITISYPGSKIPDWFEHSFHDHNYNDSSSSITVPLPPDWPCPDFLGFALCVVVAGKTCSPYSDVYCEIKFQRAGEGFGCGSPDLVCSPFRSTNKAMRIPVSDSDQVVMWYKYTDESFYCRARSADDEVSFKFSVGEQRGEPCGGRLTWCGVHMLCRNDLVGLGLVDPRVVITRRLVELEVEESSTLLENVTDLEPRDSSFWHKLCSALTSMLLVCCSHEK